MSPRKKEENEKIREEASTRLLAASLKVFAKHGYHASTMAEIAKEAGVSKGLAYHYFSSKEELLVSIAELRIQEYRPLVEALEKIEDVNERLHFLVNYVVDELVKKPDELRFYTALYLNPDGAGAIHKALKKYHDQFERQFAVEQKLFRDLGHSKPDLEAVYFRSLLQGISLEYILSPKDYPLDQIKEMLLSRYKSRK